MKFSDLKLTTPYMKLDELFYEKRKPTPLKDPFLISASQDAAKLLGVSEELIHDEHLIEILNGTYTMDGSEPFAMVYVGHQFGHFVPRLGDGRAINLGKVNGQNLQLKGAGQTLYSRHGDGRAVLRSSIREYLISEAMHGLGIQTTRALALIGSDTDVARESWEKGAVVLRLSPTWVRFGTFEYFNAIGEPQKIKILADYVIEESFAHLKGVDNAYLEMYKEIVTNTAVTIAKWQSVGFTHGVMNTDNMSIDGRTIDYGPFAFLDDYDYSYVCNHTDVEGRYAFGNQPAVAHWNLQQLAKAISPIVDYEEALKALNNFGPLFDETYLNLMYQKLGFVKSEVEDMDLVVSLLDAMGETPTDYTAFFRRLSFYDGEPKDILAMVADRKPLEMWLKKYDARLAKESLSHQERHTLMQKVNPKYVLKNHILQEAITAAEAQDYTMISDLLTLAHEPYSEHPELDHLSKPVPHTHKNRRLSCSS